MIRLSPTFLSEYHNASKGLPHGFDTNISIPTSEQSLLGKNFLWFPYKEK